MCELYAVNSRDTVNIKPNCDLFYQHSMTIRMVGDCPFGREMPRLFIEALSEHWMIPSTVLIYKKIYGVPVPWCIFALPR